jgi:hypothetical protein
MVGKFASLCWDGLTLQNVSHRKIVILYLLFVCMSLLFELFLIVLYCVSSLIFYSYRFSPSIEYYISGAILILLLFLTVSMFITTVKNHKNIFSKRRNFADRAEGVAHAGDL